MVISVTLPILPKEIIQDIILQIPFGEKNFGLLFNISKNLAEYLSKKDELWAKIYETYFVKSELIEGWEDTIYELIKYCFSIKSKTCKIVDYLLRDENNRINIFIPEKVVCPKYYWTYFYHKKGQHIQFEINLAIHIEKDAKIENNNLLIIQSYNKYWGLQECNFVGGSYLGIYEDRKSDELLHQNIFNIIAEAKNYVCSNKEYNKSLGKKLYHEDQERQEFERSLKLIKSGGGNVFDNRPTFIKKM